MKGELARQYYFHGSFSHWKQSLKKKKTQKEERKATRQSSLPLWLLALGRLWFCCKASMNNLRQASFINKCLNCLDLEDTVCVCVCVDTFSWKDL